MDLEDGKQLQGLEDGEQVQDLEDGEQWQGCEDGELIEVLEVKLLEALEGVLYDGKLPQVLGGDLLDVLEGELITVLGWGIKPGVGESNMERGSRTGSGGLSSSLAPFVETSSGLFSSLGARLWG